MIIHQEFFSVFNKDIQASFRRREWSEKKRIILEYSSLLLFGSFNGGNRKFIPLFGSLSGREWNR